MGGSPIYVATLTFLHNSLEICSLNFFTFPLSLSLALSLSCSPSFPLQKLNSVEFFKQTNYRASLSRGKFMTDPITGGHLSTDVPLVDKLDRSSEL